MLENNMHKIRKASLLLLRGAPSWIRAVLLCAILVVTGVAAVSSWPQYQQNAQHTGQAENGGDPTALAPTTNNVSWSLKTGGAVRSSATVVTSSVLQRSVKLLLAMEAGETSLQVQSTPPLFIGDLLVIDGEYLGAVLSIDATTKTVTVTYPTAAAHAVGADVQVIQRRLATMTVDSTQKGAFVTVDHPEQFMLGDQVTIGADPTPRIIANIQFANIFFTTLLPDAVIPKGTIIAAGNPGARTTYVGSDDGYLRAIDMQNSLNTAGIAVLFWKNSAFGQLGAIRGAPVVDDIKDPLNPTTSIGRRIYVASASGRIFAFAEDGHFCWAYPSFSEAGLGEIRSAPVVDAAGNIYFAADGGEQTTTNNVTTFAPAGIYALDRNGHKLAVFPLPTTGEYAMGFALLGDINQTSVFVSTTIKPTSTGKIYRLDRNLQKVWDFSTGALSAAPIIDTQNHLIIGDRNGRVYFLALDGTEALPAILKVSSPVTTSAAGTASAVYVGHDDGTVEVFDPVAGDTGITPLNVLSAVSGPLTVDAAGNLLVATNNGKVFAFHADRSEAWRWDVVANADMPVAQPLRTSPALGNGLAIVGSDDGHVYALGGATNIALNDVSSWSPSAEGIWPFFHRNARHLGSVDNYWNDTEPGSLQPTLRWFADASSPLHSSAVVTDKTPDGSTRTYAGTEEGLLSAYDASTGIKRWQFPLASVNPIIPTVPVGPIRATPSVNAIGDITFPALDGHLYLLDNNGVPKLATPIDLPSIAETIDDPNNPGQTIQGPGNAGGNAVASPVFSKDGNTIYVATADTLLQSTPVVNNTDRTVIYTFTQSTKFSSVNIPTKHAGTLKVFQELTDTDPIFNQTFNAETTTIHTLHVDLGLEAKKIIWTQTANTALDVTAFQVYASGVVSNTPLTLTFANWDQQAPFVGQELVADVRVNGAATFVHHLQITTRDPGKITVIDANLQQTTWQFLGAQGIARPLDIPINRFLTAIIWDSTSLDPNNTNGEVDDFKVFTMDFSAAGGRVYAFNTAGRRQWMFPATGYLPPITASPAAAADNTLYVATTAGQLLALKDGALSWPVTKMLAGPVVAAPIIVDEAHGAKVFVIDQISGLYLFNASDGSAVSGWPAQLAGPFSNTPAATAEGHAYIVGDNGSVYLTNLASSALGDMDVSVPAGSTQGVVWQAENVGSPVFSLNQKMLTIIGRITPVFTGDNQSVIFGFRSSTGTLYAASLFTFRNTTTGEREIRVGVNGTQVSTVKIATSLPQGIEIAVTLRNFAQSTNIIVYYRLPDAAGNYSGNFATAGEVSFSLLGTATLAPYLIGKDTDALGFQVTSKGMALYRDTDAGAAQSAVNPFVNFLTTVPSGVLSSPVLDASGQVYFGSESGAVFCLQPGTGILNWSFIPDRSIIATPILAAVNPGTTTYSVASTTGFRIGDSIRLSRADGSQAENIGQVVSITAQPKTTTTLVGAGPIMDAKNQPRILAVASTTGMNVGDDVTILANLTNQSETFIGKITLLTTTTVNATTVPAIVLDRDIVLAQVAAQAVVTNGNLVVTSIPTGVIVGSSCVVGTTTFTVIAIDPIAGTIQLNTPLPDNNEAQEFLFGVKYPVNSTVNVGSIAGSLIVSQPATQRHEVGDILRVIHNVALPIRTSPAVGPAQTVFVGADDGVLYAIGPIGPANLPGVLPALPPIEQTQEVLWNTFHADNQRTGYADRPGPRTSALRWYRSTGSTLESSPAIGAPDNTAQLGVLYVGTIDEQSVGLFSEQRGSLISYDASSGRIRWRFDDNTLMGSIYSSPTVFRTKGDTAETTDLTNEAIVFGTVDMPRFVSGFLAADSNNAGLSAGETIDRLLVTDVRFFSVGMDVSIADNLTGNNLESLGKVLAINVADKTLLLNQQTLLHDHAPGSTVVLQTSQQGHLYCVDRSGTLRWKFPAEGTTAVDAIAAVHSSPVVDSDGITYFGTDDGVIYAIDSNGKERWHFVIEVPDIIGGTPSITSAPALSKTGDRLFVSAGILSNNTGIMLALDTVTNDDNARLLWVKFAERDPVGNETLNDVPRFFPFTASPMITTVNGQDRIYIGSESQIRSNLTYPPGVFYCLNPEDGTVISQISSFLGFPISAISSTAAAVSESSNVATSVTNINGTTLTLAVIDGFQPEDRVRLFADQLGTLDARVVSVSAGAKQITLAAPLPAQWATATGVGIQTNETTIIFGSANQRLLAVDANLSPLWQVQHSRGPIRTSPAISTEVDAITKIRNYTVYFGSNDFYLNAVRFSGNTNQNPLTLTNIANQVDPVLLWTKTTRDRIFASPVVGPKTSESGHAIIFQASRDHYIYAFSDRYNYAGEPQDIYGPSDQYTPPEETEQLVPSELSLSKNVNVATQQDIATYNLLNDGNGRWWRFDVTVADIGRGLIDEVKVVDTLPATLAAHVLPVIPSAGQAGALALDEMVQITRPVAFSGNGQLNDMISTNDPNTGNTGYSGTVRKLFTVTITATPGNGVADEYSWTYTDLTTNVTSPPIAAPISGNLDPLMEGVAIRFSSLIGHTIGDRWTFTVDPNEEIWELTWSNMDIATPGVLGSGFTLHPDLKDPLLQPDTKAFQRTFTFFVKVRSSDDPYQSADTNVRPKLSVDKTSGKANNLTPEISLSDTLKLKLANYPLPNATQGLNQLTAVGRSYFGQHDIAHSQIVRARKETPVLNDWADLFTVRLYYNGFLSTDNTLWLSSQDKLKQSKIVRTFSPWNQINPDTGEPLQANLQYQLRMDPGATTPDQKTGTGAAALSLAPNVRNYTSANSAGSSSLSFMPYGWRVTVQQAKSRLGAKIEWSTELPCDFHFSTNVTEKEWIPDFIITNPLIVSSTDHPWIGTIGQGGVDTLTNSTRLALTNLQGTTASLNVNAWVVIDNPTNPDNMAQVDGFNISTLPYWISVSQPLVIEPGASVYPITDTLQMAQENVPDHVASSATIQVSNASKWSMDPTSLFNRAMLMPVDFRSMIPFTPSYAMMEQNGYAFGNTPSAGGIWNGFRYDPYTENHIGFNATALDAPKGTPLATGQGLDLHITRSVPIHQSGSVVYDQNGASTDLQYRSIVPTDVQENLVRSRYFYDGRWFLGNNLYTEKSPCIAYGASQGKTGPFFFIDLNGNQVWDKGESYYAVLPAMDILPRKDQPFTAITDSNLTLKSMQGLLGVADDDKVQTQKANMNFGRTEVYTGYQQLRSMMNIENSGNISYGNNPDGKQTNVTLALTNPNVLFRTGYPSMIKNSNGQTVYRPLNELQPFVWNSASTVNWLLMKSPAGVDAPFWTAMHLAVNGVSKPLPTATYTGTVGLSSSRTLNMPTNTLASIRVSENRISMAGPEFVQNANPDLNDPRPAYDMYNHITSWVAGQTTLPWTNYLTGTEGWPAALPLGGTQLGDLGVWVASNTPQENKLFAAGNTPKPAGKDERLDMLPKANTDTNIWFHRVKNLTFAVESFNQNGDLTLKQQTELTNTNNVLYKASELIYTQANINNGDKSFADMVFLRDTRKAVSDPSGEAYGFAATVTDNTLTVQWVTALPAGITAQYASVEVLASPWMPVLSQQTLDTLRTSLYLQDPTDQTGPTPMRCTTPSVTMYDSDNNGASEIWLLWSINAVRKVTTNGKTDYKPLSYLAYAPFNINDPLATVPHWVMPPANQQAPANAVNLDVREKPVFLPGIAVTGPNGAVTYNMVIYEGGIGSSRGLYMASCTNLVTGDWTIDVPLTVLNQGFMSTGNPQAWLSSDTNGPLVNLVFQAKRFDGNTDLYYARIRVTANGGVLLESLQSGNDTVTEVLTTSGQTGVFVGNSQCWALPSLTLMVNGNISMTLENTPGDTKPTYQAVDQASGIRLQVDPYRDIVKVLAGTVTSVQITGTQRLQRLTTHNAADVNPTVTLEFQRDETANPQLAAKPRVWLFWTRQLEDGTGSHVYYRSYRADPAVPGLQSEQRQGTTVSSVDMPERMLPMEQLSNDGTVSVVKQTNASGVWVLSTAARTLPIPYPNAFGLDAKYLGDPTKFVRVDPVMPVDLFLQLISVPVPEFAP